MDVCFGKFGKKSKIYRNFTFSIRYCYHIAEILTRNGLAWMVEIKNKAGRGIRFTPAQQLFFQQVKCPVYIVANLDDVELLIKGEKTPINR